MGAEHKLDLTSDVTHLIVGDINTPKYKYVAREREDVKVLSPEWLEAVRQSWMTAEAFDLQELEEKYKLPVFAGLSVCVTGFDDGTLNTKDVVRSFVDTMYSGISRTTAGRNYSKRWRLSRRPDQNCHSSDRQCASRKEV